MVRPRVWAVCSRVEDWRGTTRPVSSPRHLTPGVPISGPGLSWSLRVRGDATSRRGARSGTHQVPHSGLAEPPERGVAPGRTPPLPAKPPTMPRPPQVPPDAPLAPPPHTGNAPARVPDPKVVPPASPPRVDRSDHPVHRLRPGAPAHRLALLQPCRAGLRLRRVLGPPAPTQRTDAPEVEAHAAEALSPTQVHDPTLLLVQLHIACREFLSKPSAYRPHPPVLPTIMVHEDPQVIRGAHVPHGGVRAVARDRFGALEQRIDRREVQGAEARRAHAPLGQPARAGGVQDPRQPVQDLSVLHPVATGASRRVCHTLASATRSTACGAVRVGRHPHDPSWTSAATIGAKMRVRAPWTTRSRIAGIPRTRTVPPPGGIATRRVRRGRSGRVTRASRRSASHSSTPAAAMAVKVTPSLPGAPCAGVATWTYPPQTASPSQPSP